MRMSVEINTLLLVAVRFKLWITVRGDAIIKRTVVVGHEKDKSFYVLVKF